MVKEKIKKKKWVKIIAPKLFNEKHLGEISLVDPMLVIGRKIKVNLMEITNDMKKQNTEIGFKVAKLQDDKTKTKSVL